MIVHSGSVLQVQFGILDDRGNVIPQQPIQIQVQDLSPESFQAAFQRAVEHRAKLVQALKEQMAQQAPPAPKRDDAFDALLDGIRVED